MKLEEILNDSYIPPTRAPKIGKRTAKSKRFDSAEDEPVTPYEQEQARKKREAALVAKRKELLKKEK
jgi:hypothetical protein